MDKKIHWITPMSFADKIKFESYAWLFAISCGGSFFAAWLLYVNDHPFYAIVVFILMVSLVPFSKKKMDKINQKYRY